VFNATLNNISEILWLSVLLVEETGVPGQNHEPDASHWQTVAHNVVWNTPRHERDLDSLFILWILKIYRMKTRKLYQLANIADSVIFKFALIN